MASNTFNNNSIFNGTATFNSSIGLTDISANTVTSNSVTLRNSGNINGVGNITANTVTSNTTLNTPTVSLSYGGADPLPTLIVDNIGYNYFTNNPLFTGSITPDNVDKPIYQILGVASGYYILNLQVQVMNIYNQCWIFATYNSGSNSTTQINQITFSGNTQYTQTIHGSWFINVTGYTDVIGYIHSKNTTNTEVVPTPSGQMQLIRIA